MNLLSHLMQDMRRMLGIRKLNTTAYHPQCDGMVKQFNRTFKTILHKDASRFGNQWDRFLPGILWVYRNTPHESTGEKPSSLLFGQDPANSHRGMLPANHSCSGWSCRRLQRAFTHISQGDCCYFSSKGSGEIQTHHEHRVMRDTTPIKTGDWVLVHSPQDGTGANRKLSRPWHGPYRVMLLRYPDVSVTKVYFLQDQSICVHQSCVKLCPGNAFLEVSTGMAEEARTRAPSQVGLQDTSSVDQSLYATGDTPTTSSAALKEPGALVFLELIVYPYSLIQS